MSLKFKRLLPEAVLPTRAHPTDAGLDLTAVDAYRDKQNHDIIVYKTGIAVEIPKGYVGLIFPRSSVSKQQSRLSNAVGVIDSGYTGEITFKFDHKGSDYSFMNVYNIGDRVGQLVVVPCLLLEAEWTDKLTETDRGEGSYGSSGS